MTKEEAPADHGATVLERNKETKMHEASEPTNVIAIDYQVPNPTVPWRREDYSEGGALSAEQVADLAARFEIDREQLWMLSKEIGFHLGFSQPQNMTFVDMELAEQRGKERLAKAKQQAKAALGNLQRCTDELSGLSYLDRHHNEKSPFEILETEIEAIKARIKAAHADLSRHSSNPGTALDLRPPNERKIPEYHRKNV